ncbi:hypothetical protein [Corticicoccus populi]|uniref:Uncharacterized protein n=1 Tax=Corticicoccus populi TaxID=1812821 RepID=A0ABW5WV55_9STAP
MTTTSTKNNEGILELLKYTEYENLEMGDSIEELAEMTDVDAKTIEQLKAGKLFLNEISERDYKELNRFANQEDNVLTVKEDSYIALEIMKDLMDTSDLVSWEIRDGSDNGNCTLILNFGYYVSQSYMKEVYNDYRNQLLVNI